MIAWELLTANSTLTSGTAWEHLTNQELAPAEIVTVPTPTTTTIHYIVVDGVKTVIKKDVVAVLEDNNIIANIQPRPEYIVIDDSIDIGVRDA